MSEYGNLGVTVRTAAGKGAVRQLRRAGKFPAVIYGAGKENVSIAIDPREFGRASDPNKGFNTFFKLAVTTADGKVVGTETCIIADQQRDSLRTDVLHVDFMRVDPEREVVRPVPVRVTGRAAGVVKGGRIRSPYRTVKVAAKPAELPIEIVVDVTPLDNGDAIRMRDVTIPNARLVEPPDAALALCEIAYQKAEEEEAKPAAAGAAAAKPGAPAAKPGAPAAKAPAAKAPAKK
ncbi:MAG: 50S ribosomal protein L25 [Myxococcales bacterium]|nr:50S ribosomal protein L25 [Myxococcales bacterium]